MSWAGIRFSMSNRPLPFLPTFLHVVQAGSFTAAARALGISQAAVSQRIQLLEASLQTAVFFRNSSRISLTPAGTKLVEYAQKIDELHCEARAEIAAGRSEPRGELSLVASSIPGEYFLPPLLAAFRRTHSHVNICLGISDTEGVWRAIEHRESQLGFAGDDNGSKDLEFTRCADDRLVFVFHAHHPFCRRKRITLDECMREPLILRERGSGSRHCLERALRQLGYKLDTANAVLEVGSNEGVKEAILQGLGVSFLSHWVVQKEIASGSLGTTTIVGLPLRRQLFIVRNRRQPLTTITRDFLRRISGSVGGAES